MSSALLLNGVAIVITCRSRGASSLPSSRAYSPPRLQPMRVADFFMFHELPADLIRKAFEPGFKVTLRAGVEPPPPANAS